MHNENNIANTHTTKHSKQACGAATGSQHIGATRKPERRLQRGAIRVVGTWQRDSAPTARTTVAIGEVSTARNSPARPTPADGTSHTGDAATRNCS